MLDFLTTPYLFIGAGAAAVPIIIHLIHRNRAETVFFAAMRFLNKTPAHLLRRQKLKQILLLAMRILALALLGLAFARPLLVGEKGSRVLGQDSQALALVIDVSASMAAARHLQNAIASATEIVQSAGEADQISVITAGAALEVLAENAAPSQALAALPRAQQQQSTSNLREAIQFADNILHQSPLRRRRIYLISDLQATNLPLGNLTLNSTADCLPVAVTPRWQNVAVLEGERVEREGRVSYLCRVRNFADMKQEIEVRLVSGAQRARPGMTQRITLSAGEEQTILFTTAELGNATAPTVYFEIAAAVDDLPADNRFYLAPKTLGKHRVLLAIGDSNAEFFLQHALELPGSGYSVTRTSPNAIETLISEEFSAIVLAGVTGVSNNAAQKLAAYVQNGGGLFIALGNKPPNETFNHFLADLLPGTITGAASRSREQVALTEIDFAHPIFTIFRDPANGDPSSIAVTTHYQTQTKTEAIRIAGFEDGTPALLELGVGRGRVLLWTSTIDLSSGNLPMRGIFVPLLHQWIGYVRRTEPQKAATYVGQPILLSDEFAPEHGITITRPDGSKHELENAGQSTFAGTTTAGHYLFEQNGKRVWRAVNLDMRESDPAALPVEDLQARLSRPDEETQLSGVFGISAPSERDVEKQQKLWRMGLWAVLALLLCEAWLANRTPR